MPKSGRIARVDDFALGLGGCIASTTTVAGRRRSGGRTLRIIRNIDNYDFTPLPSSARAK